MVENQLGFGPVDPLEIQRAWRATAPARRPRCSEHDFSKAKSTLHSVVRDWSDEGAPERAACYAPCVAALRAALPERAILSESSAAELSPQSREPRARA